MENQKVDMYMPLRLPSVFSDHMVLQRDLDLPVWGWASPGQKITVAVAGQSVSGMTDAHGKWKVSLRPIGAGGPFEIMVTAGQETTRIDDVLVGDVWVCSGQSNMEWGLQSCTDGKQVVADAIHPKIRLLNFPKVSSVEPANNIDAAWTVCSPATAATFSGVGYFFGREIHREIGVPIGLINASWGGTSAEAWTPLSELEADPDFARLVERIHEFHQAGPLNPHEDPGNKGFEAGWSEPTFDDAAWDTMGVPGSWESHGLDMDGSVWFRRTIQIPADLIGKPWMLNLGVIDDFDVTYFNGRQVGSTGKETPNWWMTPRQYRIDAERVKPGLNSIAVRVFDQWAYGGLLGSEDSMHLAPEEDPGSKISLAGDWKYKIELALPSISPSTQVAAPTSVYNGMISPLIPFGIRGVIWYQGEANAERAVQYRKLFQTLIRSWRKLWAQGDFPFLFVQLANFLDHQDTRKGSPWAELREAQSLALALPNTGQAVTIDIGDANDIHPLNKLDVGWRLAYEAMRISYGRPAPRSPMFESASYDGAVAVLRFKFADDGLATKDGEPSGFAIAGENGVFHPAVAKLDGTTITLSSPSVPKPSAVRYGWTSNPRCNVYNLAGLPLCPFRTDDRPCATAHVK